MVATARHAVSNHESAFSPAETWETDAPYRLIRGCCRGIMSLPQPNVPEHARSRRRRALAVPSDAHHRWLRTPALAVSPLQFFKPRFTVGSRASGRRPDGWPDALTEVPARLATGLEPRAEIVRNLCKRIGTAPTSCAGCRADLALLPKLGANRRGKLRRPPWDCLRFPQAARHRPAPSNVPAPGGCRGAGRPGRVARTVPRVRSWRPVRRRDVSHLLFHKRLFQNPGTGPVS